LALVDPAAGIRNFTYTRHGPVEDETISGTGILAGQKLGGILIPS